MQVGLAILTLANCKSKLKFRQTNNYQILFLNSSKYFQSPTDMGWRNSISKATKRPARWLLCCLTIKKIWQILK